MAQPTIQTAFASGEWAPKLRSRVDLQKYKVGAALMRNFFVDWAGGGASTRQGTEFIAPVGIQGIVRLIRFQPSQNVTYVLEFGDGYLRFYSNGARIETSPGVAYEIPSPFSASDLFPNAFTGNPGIKFVQDVTSMIFCHPSYQPRILTIISPTNWTFTTINFGPTINPPVISSVTSSLSAGSYSYSYIVTAVDVNGQESGPSIPGTTAATLARLSTTDGQNNIAWLAVDGAVSYNVYKASPTFGAGVVTGAPYGFIGNTTGLSFSDATPGIGSDFSQSPPIIQNPFLGGSVKSLTLTSSGAAMGAVPAVTIAPPPSGTQATGYAALGAFGGIGIAVAGSIHSAGGIAPSGEILTLSGGVRLRIQNSSALGGNNFQVTVVAFWDFGSITGPGHPVPANPNAAISITQNADTFTFNTAPSFNLNYRVNSITLVNGGSGYLVAPAVTFSAGTATAISTLGPVSAGNPSVPGFIQQRLALAAKTQNVQSFDLSQPGSFFNFNVSFPAEDDDAISGNIVGEDLNAIRALVDVPTGLLALTNKSGWLLNGGGGISTMVPFTPSNITALPQAYHGCNDMPPIKINMDVLYVTAKGQYVRDLTYNLYMQVFTGSDITAISTHLFQGLTLVDWCWCEEPLKVVWVTRSDGTLLSLSYVKDQELVGWAHHDTDGIFVSCCTVTETIANGETVDALYVCVRRVVNNQLVQYVERMADRYFDYGAEDSWSVDCALQTTPTLTFSTTLQITGNWTVVGGAVLLIDANTTPFDGTYIGKVVRAGGGIYTITSIASPSTANATVNRVATVVFTNYNSTVNFNDGWTVWTKVTSVSGLTHLLNMPVVGVADGVAISGTVDGSGNLNLGGSYSKITIGLAFLPQLQTLPLDLGEPTVQSKRKKLPAATMRVADTLGLQIGTSFANVVTMKDFQLGNIPSVSNGPSQVTDLYSGDGRQILDQVWQEIGQLCVQQNLPYPATILGIMPEVVVGDSPEKK